MYISISKQQLASLPAAHYGGRIVVVDNPESVDMAVAELRKADLIGFDTETRPSFKKGQSFSVALLQLATSDTVFLFRLNKIGMPESVRAILQDSSKLKVGLSIHDDFRNLNKSGSLQPDGFVELQQYVSQWNIHDKSLSKLYALLFGQRLSKTQRLTNWEADSLSEAQQHYAALDAMACIQIYQYLKAGRFDPSESKYQIADTEHEKV